MGHHVLGEEGWGKGHLVYWVHLAPWQGEVGELGEGELLGLHVGQPGQLAQVGGQGKVHGRPWYKIGRSTVHFITGLLSHVV